MQLLWLAVLLALGSPLTAFAQTKPKPQAPPAPAWVTQSNRYAQILIDAQGPFRPEVFSFFGFTAYDDQVADLRPNREARYRAAIVAAKSQLEQKLQLERDLQVRQDLEIMIREAALSVDASAITERLELAWIDAPQLVFRGVKGLLSQQVQPERRGKALARLQRYVGMSPDTTPIASLARQRYEQRAADKALLRPTRLEVERALANTDTYIAGIQKLFAEYKLAGGEASLAAMAKQLTEYAAWTRSTVLPAARNETILPAELYALRLRQVGIDIDPKLLVQRAQLEFMETRAAMQQLAPHVAKEQGLAYTDYRALIRALKRSSIPNDQLEREYRKVIDAIDPIIRRERIVDLPKRPMVMRLASEAESAAQPAPHFLPAPLIGNTGQQGQFVLTLSNPSASGAADVYDDFNYAAARWTLSAHEGRPGHELQFTAIVERGVSLARSLFAFNSVNVEGWALYAEAEMLPHEPLDAQLIALQLRLLRAARAMLDPLLNLGLIDRERAGGVLTREVVVSKAMARQELDRYTFDAPGQAGSYFYGYSRILELRAETELALGDSFDVLSFNNFLLDQGMLPPELLAKAVREQFIPAARKRAIKQCEPGGPCRQG